VTAHDSVLFMWGATAAACSVIALIFMKYWRGTRDRLFLFFSVAFWILSLNWVGLAATDPHREARHWAYVLRVAAFTSIILGVLDKNRRRLQARGPEDRNASAGDSAPGSRAPRGS
jgi:hypothetical protein